MVSLPSFKPSRKATPKVDRHDTPSWFPNSLVIFNAVCTTRATAGGVQGQ